MKVTSRNPKAQYSWPPCTNKFRLDTFDQIAITFTFLNFFTKQATANCTEPSPSVTVPWSPFCTCFFAHIFETYFKRKLLKSSFCAMIKVIFMKRPPYLHLGPIESKISKCRWLLVGSSFYTGCLWLLSWRQLLQIKHIFMCVLY